MRALLDHQWGYSAHNAQTHKSRRTPADGPDVLISSLPGEFVTSHFDNFPLEQQPQTDNDDSEAENEIKIPLNLSGLNGTKPLPR